MHPGRTLAALLSVGAVIAFGLFSRGTSCGIAAPQRAYLHIASVTVDGQSVRDLTPYGQFQIEVWAPHTATQTTAPGATFAASTAGHAATYRERFDVPGSGDR